MRLYNVKVISTDIFGTKRATGDPRVSKRPDFQGLFRFPKKLEFSDFCISVFLYFLGIFGYISGTKRATGDPQVSKRPDFLGLFRFPKKELIFGFLYFCISVFFLDFWPYLRNEKSYQRSSDINTTRFLRDFHIFKKVDFLDFGISVFFGFLAISQERKELPEICWCQNDHNVEGFSDVPKNITFVFLDDRISGFLDFLDFWPYLGNEKSYRRSAGVNTTRFLRAFHISKKIEFLDFRISEFMYFCIF